MAKIVKVITADVAVENTSPAIVAKQYDNNSRFLNVTLLNEGQPIEIKQSSVVIINALREDKQSKGFAGEVNPDGSVLVPITQWMLQLDGIVNCDISIVDADTRKLTTTTFKIVVQAATNADENISEDTNYDLLVVLLSDVAKVQAEAEKQLEKIKSLTITNHKSGNPVVINDSSVFPIHDIKIFGGNQILNPELYEGVKIENGVTATPNEDGSITFTGKPTVQSGVIMYYNFGKYTNNLIDGMTYTKNKDTIVSIKNTTGTQYPTTFKFDKATMQEVKSYYELKSQSYTDGMTILPMVNQGTERLPFESYKKTLAKIEVTGAQVLKPELYQPKKTYVSGVTVEPNADGTISAIGKITNTEHGAFTYTVGKKYEQYLIDGQTYYLSKDLQGKYKLNGQVKYFGGTITFNKQTMTDIEFYIQKKVENYNDGEVFYPMVNLGTKLLPFETYKKQSAILSQPIKLATGEYLERRNYEYGKVSGDKFTPLPAADSNALLALTTFYPNTIIYSGLKTEVKYICDTKKYIDQDREATKNELNELKKIIVELQSNK